MKNRFLYVIFILFCSVILMPIAYAEEDTKCTPIMQKELRQRAEKIVGTYEFVYDNNNNVIGFNYLLYNIPDDMYVMYTGMASQKISTLEQSDILPIDRSTRQGKVFDDNLTDNYTVNFLVYQSSGECSGILRSFGIKKVRYNRYSELELCRYAGLEDFIYCQPWVETNFPYGEDEIKQKIESKLESNNKTTTSQCASCIENVKNEDEYNRLVLIRQIVIFGLISGIIIDIVVIIYLFRKAGESRL